MDKNELTVFEQAECEHFRAKEELKEAFWYYTHIETAVEALEEIEGDLDLINFRDWEDIKNHLDTAQDDYYKWLLRCKNRVDAAESAMRKADGEEYSKWAEKEVEAEDYWDYEADLKPILKAEETHEEKGGSSNTANKSAE